MADKFVKSNKSQEELKDAFDHVIKGDFQKEEMREIYEKWAGNFDQVSLSLCYTK